MTNNRRHFMGLSLSSGLGLLWGRKTDLFLGKNNRNSEHVHPLYPTTDPSHVREVVGAAHTQFDKVKELVSARPELAKATWDWGFGDVESALGAASHMGRKDIADFLIEHGARPNIFTFAMLGKLQAVKAMVEDMPGIQRIAGPHGITLVDHANMRLRRENVHGAEKEEQEALVSYLKSLGDADLKATAKDITESEQKTYLGTYNFGKGENDFFKVSLNRRGMLFLQRGEYTGRVLLLTDSHSFAPGGAPSVQIQFNVKDGVAQSLTIHDPAPLLTAVREN